jgi:hypothetical protein
MRQVLAVASHDNFIDLYHVARSTGRGQEYELYATCRGHSSYVTGIDFRFDEIVVVVAVVVIIAVVFAVMTLTIKMTKIMAHDGCR